MITSVRLLRNIGQFDTVNAGASLRLARLTLIYAENGRGKTTLAAVLRSLASGDPLPIMERRRLAAVHPPHVVIDCLGGPPPNIFENGAWTRNLPNVAVFDDTFVDQNVSSGLAIEAGHRQNLHELILGAQAVALSKRLQELVADVENHNTVLRQRAAAIPSTERGVLSVDDFCALGPLDNIDEAIEFTERALAAARDREKVRTTPGFEVITLPSFDLAAIETVLGADLPALETSAAARVQSHLSNIGPGGEAWVADGMRRIGKDQDCPFCVQNLDGSPVINQYRSYFSEGYSRVKERISESQSAIAKTHGGDVPATFERAVRLLGERRQFWSEFCEVPGIDIDTASIARDWIIAREGIFSALSAKKAAPLDSLSLSEASREAVSKFEGRRTEIAVLNARLQQSNDAIRITKEQAAAGDIAALATDLARLKAVKTRHSVATTALCDAYLLEKSAKTRTEHQRDQTRSQLEQYKTTVFGNYQNAVNTYLQRFNAGFRLDSVTSTNTRGGPTCTYNVLINNTPVPIGGAQNAGEPSFRNTLSSGDRNTLALAFFFASLDLDPNPSNIVAVIDDPISSLDDHRSLTTVQHLRRLTEQVSQVVVLSHNKPFLCRLWEGTDTTVRAALLVVRDGTGSTLSAWNVDEDCITEHDKRHALLLDYDEGGVPDSRDVARSVRPLLEAYLRVSCPQYFPPGTLLGSFRHLCEQRVGTPQQILKQSEIDELRDLTEYSNRFHHDSNPAWETEAINDGELHGFVARALAFTSP